MQKRHILPVCIAVVFLGAVTASGQVSNGGFETEGGGGVTDAADWNEIEVFGGALGAASAVDRSSASPASGTWAMDFSVVGADDFGPLAEMQQQTAAGSITPGNSYDFNFSALGDPGPGTVAFYEVLWFDGDGSDGGGPQGSATGLQSFPLNPAHTPVSDTGLIAPVTADSILIQIRLVTGAFSGAVGSMTVDDVSFAPAGAGTGACCNDMTGECTADVTEDDCLAAGSSYGGDGSSCATISPTCNCETLNESFESEGGGGAADAADWNEIEVTGGTLGATSTVDRSSANPFTGTWAMDFSVVGADDFGPVAEVQQQTPVGSVVGGTTYDFGFHALGDAGPGTVAFYEVLWFDGDGSDGGGPQGSATGLQTFPLGVAYAPVSDDGLVAPGTADSVLIQIRLVTGAFSGAVGSMSIDDVCLYGPPMAAGACCAGGACTEGSPVDCSLAGGMYQGDDTSCEGDADMDGTDGNCGDDCPDDGNKTEPGVCGCGVADDDSDGDGTEDCVDGCPDDGDKTEPGVCGCGVADDDGDGDGVEDCIDGCPDDGNKTEPGVCGCGVADDDSDGDGVEDCIDGCPNDGNKTSPGICGCGVDDNADGDGDSVPDCLDVCPGADDTVDENDNGIPDCTESAAVPTTSGLGMAVLVLLLACGLAIRARRRTA